MIDTLVSVPDAPPIEGLRFRAFAIERDLAAYVDLIREANLADGIDWLPTEDNLRNELDHADEFDPRRDILLAEVDGVLVGATTTDVRTRDDAAVHHLEGWVRPAWRRRGIGRALLRWTEGRAREVAHVDGRTGARWLSSWPQDDQADAIALYRSEGYSIGRYGFLMLRDLAEPIPELPLPDGLELRPVEPAQHRAIWDADTEAFRDHWKPAVRTEADFDRWFAMPELDTSLWRVAWEGGEVVGSVLNLVYPDENDALGVQRGWLEHVSVRRPWRRRGVASALIVASLAALRDRGLEEAALGVDAENPSGALHVYEALGFRRAKADVMYQKRFEVDEAAAG
jgi:mycothiol synthase